MLTQRKIAFRERLLFIGAGLQIFVGPVSRVAIGYSPQTITTGLQVCWRNSFNHYYSLPVIMSSNGYLVVQASNYFMYALLAVSLLRSFEQALRPFVPPCLEVALHYVDSCLIGSSVSSIRVAI